MLDELGGVLLNKNSKFEVKGLSVFVEGKEVVKGIDISVNSGEIHVLMGPNGSGKTTFVNGIIGMPGYETRGRIELDGEDISKMKIDERARKGLLVVFQDPPEIEGVKNSGVVRQALLVRGVNEDASNFKKRFEMCLNEVGLDSSFYGRHVNLGFSGGEKKRNELAHLLMISPKFAVLDEVDSGLDLDALKKASSLIRGMAKKGTGFLLITHNPRIVRYLPVKSVYVFKDGRIVERGGREVIKKLEKEGFKKIEGGTNV